MLVVYSKYNCSACESAKQLLTNKGIEFTIRNVDDDFEAFDFICSKGHRSMPQIYNADGTLFVEGGFKGLQEKLGSM